MSCRAGICNHHVYGDVDTVCGEAHLHWVGDCRNCAGCRRIVAQIVGYNYYVVVIIKAVIIIIMFWGGGRLYNCLTY